LKVFPLEKIKNICLSACCTSEDSGICVASLKLFAGCIEPTKKDMHKQIKSRRYKRLNHVDGIIQMAVCREKFTQRGPLFVDGKIRYFQTNKQTNK